MPRLRISLAAWLIVVGTIIQAQQDPVPPGAFRGASSREKVATLAGLVTGRTPVSAVSLEEYFTIALGDPDTDVREVAVQVLGFLKMRWLAQQNSSSATSDFTLTEEHAAVLTRLAGAVRKLLDDPAPRVRAVVMATLPYVGAATLVPPADEFVSLAMERFRIDSANEVKLAALRLLRQSQRADVTVFLLSVLDDTTPSIRAEAVTGLGERQTVSALPRILEMLSSDSDWFPRWHAAHALTVMWPYSRNTLGAVEARETREIDSRVRDEIGRTLINLRRKFPSEHAAAVDVAFADLIQRQRGRGKLSEASRDVLAPVAPEGNRIDTARSDQDRIAEAVCDSDVVVRGEIVPGGYFLDTDETFIFGFYSIRVSEVLRGQSIRPGDEILYVRPGGTMRLGGQEVHAEDDMFPSFGAIYYRPQIVFMKRVERFSALRASRPFDVITIDNGLARTIQKDARGALTSGMNVDQFVAAARTATCR
jgi:hypothetical protein